MIEVERKKTKCTKKRGTDAGLYRVTSVSEDDGLAGAMEEEHALEGCVKVQLKKFRIAQ